MPSDPRIQQSLDALAGRIDAFRSTLANTSEQIRLLISTRVESNGSTVEVAQAELGDFAAGRIDPERMAKLLSQVEPPTIAHGDVVGRALEVCHELLAQRENLFRVIVEEGDDLRATVGRALSEIGKAFAVTRIVELVAQGQYRDSEHAAMLDGHPFENWSRAERAVNFALVVRVAGRDVRAGGLADLLDHSFKLVLIVGGEAPPAPLVRLITPGVLVMQAVDPQELESISGFAGPAVVALMPDGAAQFRHDPTGGPVLANRMVITQLPEKKPRTLGRLSAFRQSQDLEQLEALVAGSGNSTRDSAPAPAATVGAPVASKPSAAPATEPPAAVPAALASPTDAVEKLSVWLLEQTGQIGPS